MALAAYPRRGRRAAATPDLSQTRFVLCRICFAASTRGSSRVSPQPATRRAILVPDPLSKENR
jgi:hypothetical protein